MLVGIITGIPNNTPTINKKPIITKIGLFIRLLFHLTKISLGIFSEIKSPIKSTRKLNTCFFYWNF